MLKTFSQKILAVAVAVAVVAATVYGTVSYSAMGENVPDYFYAAFSEIESIAVKDKGLAENGFAFDEVSDKLTLTSKSGGATEGYGASGNYVTATLFDGVTLKKDVRYRFKASVKVTAGKAQCFRFGGVMLNNGELYDKGTAGQNYTSNPHAYGFNQNGTSGAVWGSKTSAEVNFVFTAADNFNGFIFTFNDENKTADVATVIEITGCSLGEVVNAEDIKAASESAEKGTAQRGEVAEDSAVGDAVVFTATGSGDYAFSQWKNADGETVSNMAEYSHIISSYKKNNNLTAYFNAPVTISFDTDGGNSIAPIKGAEGSAVTLPANPVKAGFKFAGWFMDKELSTPLNIKVFPANNTTLYAKYISEDTVYEGFENDANFYLNRTFYDNFEIYEKQGESDANVASGSFSLRKKLQGGTIKSIIGKLPVVTQGTAYKLTLKYKIVDYTSSWSNLTFIMGKDNNPWSATKEIVLNSNITKNIDDFVEVSAYIYLDGTYKTFGIGCSGKYSAYIDDISIEKTTEKAVTKVTFKNDNGEDDTVIGGFAGDKLTLPTPTKENFVFYGWYTEPGFTNKFESTALPETDVTLYSRYIPDTDVTVNFVTGDGATVIAPKLGKALSALTVETPVKEGCRFEGWYLEETYKTRFNADKFPETSITVYAKWEAEGSFYQGFEDFDIDLSNNTKFEIYEKQNADDDKVLVGDKSLKADIVGTVKVGLFNQYSKLTVGKAYKISIKLNVSNVAKTGAISVANQPHRTNAWASGQKDYSLAVFNPGSRLQNKWLTYEKVIIAEKEYLGFCAWGDMTCFVDDITVAEVPIVTVKFNSMGGSAVSDMSNPVGIEMKVDDPTHPNGLSFAGWYTEPEYKNRYIVKYFPDENITLYAKWISAGVFEQDFEAWDYTGNPAFSDDVLRLYKKTGENDTNVVNGNYSLYYKSEDIQNAKILTLFDKSMKPLKVGEKYVLSYSIKPEKAGVDEYSTKGFGFQIAYTTQKENGWSFNNNVTGGKGPQINYLGYVFHHDKFTKERYTCTSGAVTTATERDKNGWIHGTITFTAKEEYASLILSSAPCSVYIDNIKIAPLSNGVIDTNYSNPYCEDFYNILGDIGAENALNTAHKQIFKLTLEARGDYVLSANVLKGKNVNAYLAWDSEGKNPIKGSEIGSDATKNKLTSVRFVTDKTGVVYLVTKGEANSADMFRLFSAKFGYESDPNPDYKFPTVDYGKLPSKDALKFSIAE